MESGLRPTKGRMWAVQRQGIPNEQHPAVLKRRLRCAKVRDHLDKGLLDAQHDLEQRRGKRRGPRPVEQHGPHVRAQVAGGHDVVVAVAVEAVRHDGVNRVGGLVGVPQKVEQLFVVGERPVLARDGVHDAVVAVHHVHGDAPPKEVLGGGGDAARGHRAAPCDVAGVLAADTRQVFGPEDRVGAVCADDQIRCGVGHRGGLAVPDGQDHAIALLLAGAFHVQDLLAALVDDLAVCGFRGGWRRVVGTTVPIKQGAKAKVPRVPAGDLAAGVGKDGEAAIALQELHPIALVREGLRSAIMAIQPDHGVGPQTDTGHVTLAFVLVPFEDRHIMARVLQGDSTGQTCEGASNL